jgi:predicted DCC family thiol-disulfide oxidoreductase YuxK
VERQTQDVRGNNKLVFCPLQTPLGKQFCDEHNMPVDLSTAVLIEYDEQQPPQSHAYLHSTSVLKMFLLMAFPWNVIGMIALLVPVVVRDWAYQVFARNRGMIWKTVKRITGMGDTQMMPYRNNIIGLPVQNDDELSQFPPSWGFSSSTTTKEEDVDDKKKES